MRNPMRIGLKGTCTVLLGCASLCAGGAGPDTEEDLSLAAYGLEYRVQVLTSPRTNRVRILRMDTRGGRANLAVAVAPDPDGDGPAEAALTNPFRLAAPGTLAFINTNPWDSFPDENGKKNRNWFEGQAVDINGLALAAGMERSPAGKECVPIRVTPQGRVTIGAREADPSATEGVAGWGQVVMDAKVLVQPSEKLAPRTAIGVNRDSSVVWLVVIDGRQPGYSEGMSVREVAEFMVRLGCWNAANMDGGGSSVMALAGSDGDLHTVNSPSDRSSLGRPVIRPLPMILTVRKAGSPAAPPETHPEGASPK